jgi:hypothetical protein
MRTGGAVEGNSAAAGMTDATSPSSTPKGHRIVTGGKRCPIIQ